MRLRRVTVGAVGVLAGLAFSNRRLEKVGEPARLAGGEERRYPWRGGEPGARPLLLVHGVYAGASSYEYRKNFLELAEDFRVYALDLLGCGLSDRPRRRYGPEDVAAQVEDFAREEIGAPAHLISSSLSAALLVPVAVRSPRLFKTLIAWGQEARTTPVSQARRFIRTNPRTELKIFRNAALLPHDERAAAFNEEVRAFLLGESSR